MKLLCRPLSAFDRIPDRFYVISMEFLSLSRRRSSTQNIPSSEEQGETDVFAGYLPHVSTLSEKGAANQLIDHMTTNDLHMPLQSAYKQNHSTESALLKVKNDILLNMEAQKVTLLVLLDLSAAFDTVRHDILLNRLKSSFGADGKALEWFASYLADRTQCVAVNDGLSSAFPLRQGVPLGSCLGPLLFTVYTSKLFDTGTG